MADSSSKTVLVAVDESEHSSRALEWYVRALHRPQHRVVVLSVLEVSYVELVGSYPCVAPENVTWRELLEKKRKHVEQYLRQKVEEASCTEETLPVEIKILESPRPGELIVEEAKKMRAEMVVMGTRGMGKLRRTILGSVSDYVIHHAHCPVLVCRNTESA